MKARNLAIALVATCFTTGCDIAGQIGGLPSFYLGDWTGNWTNRVSSNDGTLDIAIAADGTITGNMTRTSDGVTGTITGIVQRNGEFTAAVDFASGTDYGLSGTFTKSGTSLITNFQYVENGTQFGTATLTKPSG